MPKPAAALLAALALAAPALAAPQGGPAYGYTVDLPEGWKAATDDALKRVQTTQDRFEFLANWNASSFADGQIECYFIASEEKSSAGKTQDELNTQTTGFVDGMNQRMEAMKAQGIDFSAEVLEHDGIKGASVRIMGDQNGKSAFKHDLYWALPGVTLNAACTGFAATPDYEAIQAALPSFVPVTPE